MNSSRWVDAGRRKFVESTFSIWQRLGIHVTENHYYQPIPDTRDLKDDVWQVSSEMPGVAINYERQLDFLRRLARDYSMEYNALPMRKEESGGGYYIANGQYEAVDAEILYAMMRHWKPKRIVEIGSGFSTLVAAMAVCRNREEGRPCEYEAVDPYPRTIEGRTVDGLARVIRTPVEELPIEWFAKLERNDVLLIDSSHVLRVGGDVKFEFLEILPRVNPGVIVHIHDIFLPAEYPKEWIMERRRFWTEQYLLQAFLCYNAEFEILWGSSAMHLKHPDALAQHIPSYAKHPNWPASFWIRRL